jgi:hypothetical protein
MAVSYGCIGIRRVGRTHAGDADARPWESMETYLDTEPTVEPKATIEEWAERIHDALQDLKGLDLTLDQTRRVLVKFPPNVTDYVTVTLDQPAEYVYVPSMPRNVAVYFGYGVGQLLAQVGIGKPFLARFPRIDALTFVPDAGSGNADQCDLWYSTRPIDLSGVLAGSSFAVATASDTLANPTTGEVLAFGMAWDGALWRRVRTASVFRQFAATAIVAGTGLVVWTPAAGKRFRLMGWLLSTNTVADLILCDNAVGAPFARTGPQQINTGVASPPNMGNGFLSAAANNVLRLDVSVAATVGGMVFGTEE